MKTYTPVAVNQVDCLICDRCKTPYTCRVEMGEFLCIDTQAGYASVFGDGNQVQLDLCQYCQMEVLGDWIRITPED